MIEKKKDKRKSLLILRTIINDLQYWLVCSKSGVSMRELKVDSQTVHVEGIKFTLSF